MKIKLDGFYYLKDAIKYGSLSVAAKHNYMTQPNFSKEITKLEEALGVELLIRTKKGVAPTDMYRKIEKKIDDLLFTLNDIERVCSEKKLNISIGANFAVNNDIIYQTFKSIGYCYKNENEFDISLKRFPNDVLVDLLLKQKINYAIMVDWFNDIHLMKNVNQLKLVKIYEDDIVICIGPKSPYWDKDALKMVEFFSLPQFTFMEDLKKEEQNYYNAFGHIPYDICYTNDFDSAINIISNSKNCFMTLYSAIVDNPYLKDGKIKILPIEEITNKTSLYLAYQSTNDDTKNNMFIKKLIENINKSKQLSK